MFTSITMLSDVQIDQEICGGGKKRRHSSSNKNSFNHITTGSFNRSTTVTSSPVQNIAASNDNHPSGSPGTGILPPIGAVAQSIVQTSAQTNTNVCVVL